MVQPMRLTLLVVLAALVGGCDYGNGLAPTPTPAPSEPVAIQHLTGPTDVVLRFEFSGGFVLPEYLATQAPIFTLYGDGTVVFRNPNQDPLPTIGSVAPLRPHRITKLSEDQVQTVLADALDRGGLGVARADYSENQIMDLPIAIYTINAGGINKKVSITGLGMDIGSTADAHALAAFAELLTRLEDFDNGGAFPTDEFVPARYRGSLIDGQAGIPGAKPWPWTTIAPANFATDSNPNGFPLPARVLSAADVEALGITPYTGGFQGLPLISPDGAVAYTFSLRPLLPDEAK